MTAQQQQRIRPGMGVFGADERLIGMITSVHADAMIGSIDIDCRGDECRVPITAIDRVVGDRVFLPNPADQYLSQPHARAARSERPDSAEAVPVAAVIDPHADQAMLDGSR